MTRLAFVVDAEMFPGPAASHDLPCKMYEIIFQCGHWSPRLLEIHINVRKFFSCHHCLAQLFHGSIMITLCRIVGRSGSFHQWEHRTWLIQLELPRQFFDFIIKQKMVAFWFPLIRLFFTHQPGMLQSMSLDPSITHLHQSWHRNTSPLDWSCGLCMRMTKASCPCI